MDVLLIARFTMQLAKYPLVLYVKPSNKVYICFIIWLCLTKTGNYRIHEFDGLKSILTAVYIFPFRPSSRPVSFFVEKVVN